MPVRPRPTRPGHGRLPPAARPHDGEHSVHAVPTAQPPTASTTSRATARQATTPTGSPNLCPTSGNAVLSSGKTPASKYPDELRERAVREVRTTGRPIAHVAMDQGIHKEALRNWVRQAEADAGERDDQLTTAEREELRQLRREDPVGGPSRTAGVVAPHLTCPQLNVDNTTR
ncbi:transposase [Streptomyces sp. NPDC002550]